MAVFLFGCATDDAASKKKEKSDDELMAEALKHFEDEYYLNAIESFQKIIDRYPYSKHVPEAELKMADSYYHEGKYDEAFDAYTEFQRLHPKNPNIPYVFYQKGMCHFVQVSTLDRDQWHTLQAKEEFERLIANFPDSEYADQTHWRIRECYMKLAESELYVGHFYFKMKKYKSAMNRYRYILENYPDLGQYHEALEYLGKCKEKLAEEESSEKKEAGWFGGIFSIFN
jgi:outer membrane protein assembly factor BamD